MDNISQIPVNKQIQRYTQLIDNLNTIGSEFFDDDISVDELIYILNIKIQSLTKERNENH